MQRNNDDINILNDIVYEYVDFIEKISDRIDLFLSSDYKEKVRQAKNEIKQLTISLSKVSDPNKRAVVEAEIKNKNEKFADLSMKPMSFMKKQQEKLAALEEEIHKESEKFNDRNAVGQIMGRLTHPPELFAKRQEVKRLLKEGAQNSTPPAREKEIIERLNELSKEILMFLPKRPPVSSLNLSSSSGHKRSSQPLPAPRDPATVRSRSGSVPPKQPVGLFKMSGLFSSEKTTSQSKKETQKHSLTQSKNKKK